MGALFDLNRERLYRKAVKERNALRDENLTLRSECRELKRLLNEFRNAEFVALNQVAQLRHELERSAALVTESWDSYLWLSEEWERRWGFRPRRPEAEADA